MFTPHYFAKSGEAAVMSELFSRGYNSAAPTLDDGDDLYVTDRMANLIRIQVKSCTGLKTPYGFVGDVNLKLKQLHEVKNTPLIYVFAFRWQNEWYYLVISRESLLQKHEAEGAGKVNGIWIRFRCKFFLDQDMVKCVDADFTEFLGWDRKFPEINEPNPKSKKNRSIKPRSEKGK